MPLTAGTKLGPYEILAPIGAGGMGEVYKAKDSRLERLVAIKTLPAHLTENADALARFKREAKAVAALNHPNILAVHDLGSESGTEFMVMELLEGESLRTRLEHGPLPLRKILDLGAQAAHGLAAAHGKGILHRDLKPENLWITRDGRLKILDFGLAKLSVPTGRGSQSLIETEAVSSHSTEKGSLLGTLAYMSPEQARGEALDTRSDLFSLGAVLYEMATGKRAFSGNSGSETLAAILRDDPPDFEESNGKAIPQGLRRVLDHCLEKDPDLRFHNAQDLAFALETLSGDSHTSGSSGLTPARAHRLSKLTPLAGAALVGGLLTAGAFLLFRPQPATPRPVALRYLTYSGHDSFPAVSPDGRTIAFTSDRDGTSRIWIKQLKGGGEAALSAGPDELPRFAPDGSAILFIRRTGDHQALYRMSVLGTDPRKLADNAQYGDWSPDGKQIAFLRQTMENGVSITGVWLLAADGGNARELARIRGIFMSQPRWSPDGRSLMLTKDQSNQSGSMGGLIRVDAATGATQEIRAARAFGQVSSVVWIGNDAVIYTQAESVAGNVAASSAMAYREDLASGTVRPLFWCPSNAFTLDLLADGRVVMDSHQGHASLREITLDGSAPPRWLTQGSSFDRQPVFSPDGEWVAFSTNRSGNLDLWALSTKSGMVRSLTDDAAEDWDPGFTPDGKNLLWSSDRSGSFEIWIANSDGSSPHQVSHDGKDAENPTMTRDGQWIVYASANPKGQGIWKVHPDGSGAVILYPGSNQSIPEVSPDGLYTAFIDQSDPLTVQVRVIRIADGARVFATPVQYFRKATEAMGRCRWMPDGRQLTFMGQTPKGVNGIYIQDFVPGHDTLATRKPLAGFDTDWTTESFGLSPDGKRIVLSQYDRAFSLVMADGVPGLQKGSQ